MHHTVPHRAQDADLIMLGLATHEAFFTILREEVIFNNTKCALCGQEGHFASDCQGKPRELTAEAAPAKSERPFQFLHIYILRCALACGMSELHGIRVSLSSCGVCVSFVQRVSGQGNAH